MATIGPTRLILINAAKFSYAEIDLTKPLHLVGQNNVGKTTLVNLLQFLYIDNLSDMSFSGYSLPETRRYYFPDQHSYVLFECQTTSGMRVVGFYGKGPANNYDVERFAYEGYFERSDFLNETRGEHTPRTVAEVKIRLAVKGFTPLAPKHLRAALTGNGTDKGVRLGLVPVRGANGYGKFKDLFKGLIRLRRLRQEDLKTTLCDTYAADIGTRSVDLEKKYSEQFAKVREQRRQVENLERIAPSIDSAVEYARTQKQLRQQIVRQWHTLEHTTRRYRKDLEDAEEQVTNTVRTKHNVIASTRRKRDTLDTQRDEQSEAIAGLKRDVEEANDLIRKCQHVDPDALAEKIKTREDERSGLLAQLKDVETTSPDRIRRRIQSAENERQDLKGRLRGLNTQLGPMLRRELGDDVLNRLFRGLNPSILNLDQKGRHLDLSDPEALINQLRAYDDGLDGTTLSASWGHLSLDGLRAPDLSTYLDPERIRRDLQEKERRLQTLNARLKVAINQAETRTREENLREQIRKHRDTLADYEKSLQARESLPSLKDRLRAATEKRQAIASQIRTLRADLSQHNEELRAAEERQASLQSAQSELSQMGRELEAPSDEWAAASEQEHTDREHAASADEDDRPTYDVPEQGDPLAPIRPLFRTFREKTRAETEASRSLRKSLDHIHQTTYGKYERESPSATLQQLREERKALERRRAKAEQLWKQLLTGLSRNLHDLIDGLERLRTKVSTINRRLGSTSVSDLERLRVEIRDVSSTVNMIQRMNDRNQAPLFSDAESFEADMNHLDTMLRKHPRIEIEDLFDVGFEITTVDGETKRYDGLENIQSNGTGITIKVLIHLVLINDLLSDGEKSLPFYLDEASSLDERNLKGIVDAAREMAFVPILASPNESSAVDHIYFLRPDGDRVYLGPEHCVSTTEHHPSSM